MAKQDRQGQQGRRSRPRRRPPPGRRRRRSSTPPRSEEARSAGASPPPEGSPAPGPTSAAAWLSGPYAKAVAKAPERKKSFRTTSGGTLQPVYGPDDVAPGLDGPPRLPGRLPLHPRRAAHHVPRPLLDHAPVRRLRHRRGVEQALPLPARAGPDRPLGGLRPAHADGLRLRPPARARRGGQGGRGHRLDRRHGDAVRRDPARQGLHLDDHQRDGRRSCSPSTWRWPRSRAWPPADLQGTIQNDILKEYVARGTYIYPPRPSHPPHHRHLRLHREGHAEVEHHLHLRLPHPRGRLDGGAGGGLHAGRRHRLRGGGGARPGSTSTPSPGGSPSSSTPTTTSSRRWPSSAPPAASGPAS